MEGMAGGGGGGGKQNTIPRNQMTKRNSWADDAVWRGEEGKRFSNTGLVGRDSRQSTVERFAHHTWFNQKVQRQKK